MAKEKQFQETGKIDRAGFGSYLTGISKLGWINCDRFSRSGRNLSQLKIAEVEAGTKHYLIYKNIRSFVGPERKENMVLFNGIAVGEAVKLVAVKLQGDKPYMAIKDFELEEGKTMVLDFFPCDLTQIRHELNSVDPTVEKAPESEYDLSLEVFPNPTTEAFTANVQPADKLEKLELYSMNGSVLKSVDSPNQESEETQVSVSDLQSGVYVVTAFFNNGRMTSQRLVVD